MCFKSTYFNQNKGSFQIEPNKVSKFGRLVRYLHGGSDKLPVFIAVGQTSDFFPFLSWQMIPTGRPMLSYTVNIKMRQKMVQGLLFNMFNEWVSKLTLLYTHGLITTCLNFLAFYQIHHGCGEWVPPIYESFTFHEDAQEVCIMV